MDPGGLLSMSVIKLTWPKCYAGRGILAEAKAIYKPRRLNNKSVLPFLEAVFVSNSQGRDLKRSEIRSPLQLAQYQLFKSQP